MLAAGSGPASIYAADKLARVRAYRESGGPVALHRLDHYWDTLELFAVAPPRAAVPDGARARSCPELEPEPEEEAPR